MTKTTATTPKKKKAFLVKRIKIVICAERIGFSNKQVTMNCRLSPLKFLKEL